MANHDKHNESIIREINQTLLSDFLLVLIEEDCPECKCSHFVDAGLLPPREVDACWSHNKAAFEKAIRERDGVINRDGYAINKCVLYRITLDDDHMPQFELANTMSIREMKKGTTK